MRLTSERLPWLEDEPPVARPAAAPVRKAGGTGRAMWPWYLLLLLLIGLVGLGAWWLGTRQHDAPPPQLPVEQPVAIPVTELPPEAAVVVEQQEPEALPTPPPSVRTARNGAEAPARSGRSTEAAAPVAGDEDSLEGSRGVFPADEPAAAPPPPTGPRPVVVYHPQTDRGRVVQLGAFPTRAQADQVWRRVTRRYPYLASKPKMVNTVDVRGLGGGRRTRMYRLQPGTSSQAQSVVICQQLEKAGQSCVVVY